MSVSFTSRKGRNPKFMTDFPRLCLIGPMLGGNPGWVVSQGEILARHFQNEGWPVRLTSPVPGRVKRLVDTIRSLIAWRNDYDLAVVMVFSGPAFFMAEVSSLIAKRLGKPVVFYLHGGNLPDFTSRHPAWAKRVLQRGSAVCSPSGYLAEFFNQNGLSVQVIPNVIDIEKYPFHMRAQVSPKMLWMRTYHPAYNPEMAIDVLAELVRMHPGACLTMAGQDKGLLGSAEQRAQDAKLGSQGSICRFFGYYPKTKRIWFTRYIPSYKQN